MARRAPHRGVEWLFGKENHLVFPEAFLKAVILRDV